MQAPSEQAGNAQVAHARGLMSEDELAALDAPLDDDGAPAAEAPQDDPEQTDPTPTEPPAGDAAADAGDAGQDDAQAQAEAAAAQAVGEPPAAAVVEPEPANITHAPTLAYELPADYEDQHKAVEDAFNDLETRFEDGELTRTEYATEQRRLAREEAKLDRMKERADEAAERYEAESKEFQERVTKTWVASLAEYNKWSGSPDGGGIVFEPGTPLGRLLGEACDQVVNENPGMTPLDAWREAGARVRKSLGIAKPAPAPTAPDAKAAKAAKEAVAAARRMDRSVAPATLAGVTGEGADVHENKFAWLEKLEGEAFEAAFARMPPTEREAFMAQA